jgi:asparagine synthase (glutamine-hydrolysing)
VSRQALARQFFGRDLSGHDAPGFAHATRWRTTAALKRLLSAPLRASLRGRDAVAEFLDTLPAEFRQWSPLAQDQYIEVRTLLSGYLLSSQGDRMLMANSVEGRFPFLDKDVVALADSLPASYKLRVLDEKHVVKRASRDLVAAEIAARPKQPYRAPDAASFLAPDAREYVEDLLAESSVRGGGVFEPAAVSRLWAKCKAQAGRGLSNTDNMALLGVLSTQLLHRQFVHGRCTAAPPAALRTDVDRTRGWETRGQAPRAALHPAPYQAT